MRNIFKSGLIWIWVAIVVIVLDRISKLWVLNHLTYSEPLSILPIFNLTLVYNTGAAFSFLHTASGWQNILLGSIAGIISVTILIWLARLSPRERWLSIALCLILGGALGNAWDRILYQHVIDFLDFHLGERHFAIFNIADAAICIGAGLMILHWLLYPKK